MFLALIIAIAAVALIAASAFVLVRNRGSDLQVEKRPSPPTIPKPKAQPQAPDDGADLAGGDTAATATAEPAAEVEQPAAKPSFRDRLSKARSSFSGYLGSVFSRGAINDETWESLEEALIRADAGVATASDVIESVRAAAAAEGIDDASELSALVKADIAQRLAGFDRSLSLTTDGGPAIWLFVGVNGVGKTTTIGKIASRQSREGHKMVLAAGDTFRAAAAEQLGMWADRSDVDIVRGADGADPSSVVFDAVERAAARGADLVLADTAGRLHTKTNLMEELRKVRRVAEKGAGTVTETLLVIDATTGQNGMSQAKLFAEAVDVTGVVLTKLDGSARGGIVLSIHSELGLPVKLVGLGEGIDDLVDFDPEEFVDALFD